LGHFKEAPGRDYAGAVVAGDRWEGKEVWGAGPGLGVIRDGTHAQYVVVASDWLSEKPSHLSMQQAAAVGVPYLTTWSALVRAANIQPGETVLITGASGAVGRAAAQIAHWKKAKVIGAGISQAPPEADVFINTTERELPTEVLALTNRKGADIFLDAVGGPMFEPSLKSLRLGGRHVAITSVGNRRVEFDLIDFYHNLSHLIGVDTLTGSEIAKMMDQLRVGFDEGQLQAPDGETWPLDFRK
jgi:NADPH:quinone reductase